jgi:hypothetical protein
MPWKLFHSRKYDVLYTTGERRRTAVCAWAPGVPLGWDDDQTEVVCYFPFGLFPCVRRPDVLAGAARIDLVSTYHKSSPIFIFIIRKTGKANGNAPAIEMLLNKELIAKDLSGWQTWSFLLQERAGYLNE